MPVSLAEAEVKVERAGRVLTVDFPGSVPASGKRIETRSGVVRWAMLDDTLLVQPECEIDASDVAHREHLIRTVIRASGLARRYHVFTVRSR